MRPFTSRTVVDGVAYGAYSPKASSVSLPESYREGYRTWRSLLKANDVSGAESRMLPLGVLKLRAAPTSRENAAPVETDA